MNLDRQTASRAQEFLDRKRDPSTNRKEARGGWWLIIFLVLLLAILGYSVWHLVRTVSGQKVKEAPGIQSIVVEPLKTPAPSEPAPTPTTPTTPATTTTTTTSATTTTGTDATTGTALTPSDTLKATSLRVLNGGAAKGTAGKLLTALNKTGLSKTSVGDADSDYTGTTVYYQADAYKERAEEVVKLLESIGTKGAVTKKAESSTGETGNTPIVIITGK
jgi:cytoskeletal protein RodZ